MINEALLQEQVCNYIKLQYPNVLFRSDLGGIRLTMGQAAKVKRQQAGRAWPDLFIARPRGDLNRFFSGLFIELKKEGTRLKKRNGQYASPHLQEQADVLIELNACGYKASFAVGFDQAKRLIDDYLK
jgi:hypothetical protein